MPRLISFANLEEKARWLDAAASLDAQSTFVRHLAHELVGRIPSRTGGGETIARALHRWVRDEIGYRRDVYDGVRREVFADSETVARRRFDDCDGKSRLLVALVRALDRPDVVQARIRPVFPKPNDFRHVQVELRWPGVPWQLGEVTIAGVGVGDDPARKRKPDGSYPIAGPPR